MSRLLSLPPEVLLLIIDKVLPQDLDNFCQCCPELEQFAEIALKRHKSMKIFSHVACGLIYEHGHEPIIYQYPTQILLAILKDPRYAYYPKSLKIGSSEAEILDEETSEMMDEAYKIVEKYRDKFQALISESSYLKRDDIVNDWKLRTKRGEGSPMAAMAMSLLPNLESIILADLAANDEDMVEILDGIIRAYVESSPGEVLALGKLSKVSLKNDEFELRDITMIGRFALLPSVRQIHGQGIDGLEFKWSFEGPNSGVTELVLERSAIPHSSFAVMFSRLKALQKFKYEANGVGYYDDSWAPQSLIKTLQKYTKNCLEELDLTLLNRDQTIFDFEDDGPDFMASLRGFKKLKHVRVDFQMFFQGSNGGEIDCDSC